MSAPVGAVLAGGAGSRLGGEKPVTPLAGRPLIAWPLAALTAVLEDVAVVAKDDIVLPALDPAVAVWREPPEPRHPLAGIVEALRRADGRAVVVLACDLPFVTPGLVGRLATERSAGAAAVVAVAGGHPQPLCARYEPEALAALEGFDPDGRLLAQVGALVPAQIEVPDALLLNVNDPADLAAAERLLA